MSKIIASAAITGGYKILERVDLDRTLVVVLSDHGFTSFRRGVNLNRWLLDHGYLVLKEGCDGSSEWLQDVDWSRTRAYAVGLVGIGVLGAVVARISPTVCVAIGAAVAVEHRDHGNQVEVVVVEVAPPHADRHDGRHQERQEHRRQWHADCSPDIPEQRYPSG